MFSQKKCCKTNSDSIAVVLETLMSKRAVGYPELSLLEQLTQEL